MTQLASAFRVPFHTSGCTTCWPLPWWTIFMRVGSSPLFHGARPFRVSARRKCFIDTVSPALSSVRSNTVCATESRCGLRLVGWLKRQGSMP